MSCFEIHDPAFGRFVMGNAPVKQLATGFDWVEGPVWFGDAGCLLFSDIPNDKILRYTPGGRDFDLSRAVQLRQRTHPRPSGAAGVV